MSFTSTILPVSMRGYRRCFYIIPLKKLQEVTACKLSACICHQHSWWPGPLEPTFCYALDCMLCRTAGCRSCHMKVCCLVQDVVKVKGLTPFTGPRYPINKYLIIEIQLMLEGTWSGNFWDVDGCTSFAFHVENCLRNFRSDSLHSQHGAKLLRAWVAQVLMCSSEHSLFLPWESSEPVVLGWHFPGITLDWGSRARHHGFRT